MKKTSKKQNRNAKAAVAATMMAMPILSMPAIGIAQKSPTTTETTTTTTTTTRIKSPIFKFESVLEKHKGDLWIAGIGDGHTIYENSRGEFFYIDPSTGDMKMVTGKHFDKVEIRNLRYVKVKDASVDGADIKSTGAEKQHGKITLVGVDAQGNVIEMNSRGEKFYLNTVTGDMVFVK
jgi:hypothetical protein